MNTPHKHKEIIIAWANGGQIEFKTTSGVFVDYEPTAFFGCLEFRVKPEVKDTPEQIRAAKIEALRKQLNDLEGEK